MGWLDAKRSLRRGAGLRQSRTPPAHERLYKSAVAAVGVAVIPRRATDDAPRTKGLTARRVLPAHLVRDGPRRGRVGALGADDHWPRSGGVENPSGLGRCD